MLKKQHLVVIVLFFAIYTKPGILFSQDYKGAVGARFGYGIGVTGQYFIQNGHAMEFLLRYGYHGLILNKPGINVQALYEKHWELGRSNFKAYVGAGPTIGYGKKISGSIQNYFAIGVSPVVGFDYCTQKLTVPLIFSLDYKPSLYVDIPLNSNLQTTFDISYYELAFSVRIGIGKKRR